MGTAWRGGKAAIDQCNSIVGGSAHFDRLDQSLALLLGQAPKLIDKCLKILGFHDVLP